MKTRTPGEKSQIFCEPCNKLGSGTWSNGTLTLKDGRTVDDVMLVKCDGCDETLGTATQSASRIREAIDRPAVQP